MLTSFATASSPPGGPTFNFGGTAGPQNDWASVDGLGRLSGGSETITMANQGQVQHSYIYEYDMRSELTFTYVTNVGPNIDVSDIYSYDRAGNIEIHFHYPSWDPSVVTPFSFHGDLMTHAGPTTLAWDENGSLKLKEDETVTTLTYNWDNKLRTGQKGSSSISVKYDPIGNRVYKNSSGTTRKYIIDVAGNLPTILLEIGAGPDGLFGTGDDVVTKTYVYANGQILAQHDGCYSANRYFYLHDRLGSVREIIGQNGTVAKHYTFDAFGKTLEETGTLTNPFMFTGQYYDSETGEYYLRARQYDPQLMRFTGKDGLTGQFPRPLSLHKYLYCENEPINRIDPLGLYYELPDAGSYYDETETQTILDMAITTVGYYGPILGPYEAFVSSWKYGPRGKFDYKGSGLTFKLAGYGNVADHDFGNYLAAYSCYYNYGKKGLFGIVLGGDFYAVTEGWTQWKPWQCDDLNSILWITRGALDANLRLKSEHRRGINERIDEIFLQNTKHQVGIFGFAADPTDLAVDWMY